MQILGKSLCRPALWLEITEINLQNGQGEASSAGKNPSDPLKTCKKVKCVEETRLTQLSKGVYCG